MPFDAPRDRCCSNRSDRLEGVRRAWAGRTPGGGRSPAVTQRDRIEKVIGRRVWDSRGRPTVEAEVVLASGVSGRSIAPAGASTGINEAVDLRDGGRAFGGLGVDRAVGHVCTEIANALGGMSVMDQAAIDRTLIELDGTPNKARLGGNATVAVSMAALHAAAAARAMPLWRHLAEGDQPTLPMPMVQIFGGGAHAGRRVDIQDFLVVPIGASTFDEAIAIAVRIYESAGRDHGGARRAPRCGRRRRLVAGVLLQQRRARCAPSRHRTSGSQARDRRGDRHRRRGVAAASRLSAIASLPRIAR